MSPVATEDELIAARKTHGGLLPSMYPTAGIEQLDQAVANRTEAVKIALHPEKRAELPHEADFKGNEKTYAVFGRVVARRGPFIVLRTPDGDIQALVRKDELKHDEQIAFQQLDLADHVWVQGPLMQTKTGDAAVRVRAYRHLSKALLPPPEKWHGMSDIEKRYRERYVDLFANPAVAEVFRARALILQALRAFFTSRGFLEVQTPMLHPLRGGATAKPFVTHHNTLDMQLYMRIAPELYLKRLLVGGIDRVFEIGRAFRNEGISTRHNPEFTIIEFYAAYASITDLVRWTQELLREVDNTVAVAFPEFLHGRTYTFAEGFETVTMRQAVLDVARLAAGTYPVTDGISVPSIYRDHIRPEVLADEAALGRACEALASALPPKDKKFLLERESLGERIFALFEIFVEPMLTHLYRTSDGRYSKPVFIVEYPAEVSPLARRNDQHPQWVDRFELYVEGRELANAFNELNDPIDQAARFEEQLSLQAAGDEEAMDFDADYVRALMHGMPPAGGFGLGIDRLVMLLTGQKSIRDVLLFPLMRPEHRQDLSEAGAQKSQPE